MNFLETLPALPGVLAWVAGAGLAILGICRYMPGVGGAIVNVIYDILAPRASKEADARMEALAKAAHFVFDKIEEAKPDSTIGALKGRFTTKMPESIKETIRAWQAEEKKDQPQAP